MTAILDNERICDICKQYIKGQHSVTDWGHTYDYNSGIFRKVKVIYPCINQYIEERFDVAVNSESNKAFKKTSPWKNILRLFIRLGRAGLAIAKLPCRQ